MSKIKIVPLTKNIGAKIIGLDLKDNISKDESEVIRNALAFYGVLILRGQTLEPVHQVNFTRFWRAYDKS